MGEKWGQTPFPQKWGLTPFFLTPLFRNCAGAADAACASSTGFSKVSLITGFQELNAAEKRKFV